MILCWSHQPRIPAPKDCKGTEEWKWTVKQAMTFTVTAQSSDRLEEIIYEF